MEENFLYTKAVDESQKGMRLDKFLVLSFSDMSRSQLQRLVEQGMVSRDDDVVVDNSMKVKLDDVYQVIVPDAVEAEPVAEDLDIDVVYEDEDLIVVNKRVGMTVHPAPGAYSGTLVNALLFHCKDNLSGIGGVKRPGIVHRIDKDTSGLLVVAKNDVTHRGLSEQFFEHSVERTYISVVSGKMNPLSGKIEGNIGRSPYDRQKMAVVKKGGKRAVTNYKTLETFGNTASLVQCNLETGRTHQIRVHLANAGCALVGDKVYGKGKKLLLKGVDDETRSVVESFDRQALHAISLGFFHPVKKVKMEFCSELADDMKVLIEHLKRI